MGKYSIGNDVIINNGIDVLDAVEDKKTFNDELNYRKEYIKKLLIKFKDIIPSNDRVLIAVDLKYKDRVLLGESGVVLERPRDYDNLNHRETKISQGWVVNSDYLPIGSEVLVSHNSFHDTNRLFGLDIEIELLNIGVYAVPKMETYCYKYGSKKWNACEGFLLGMKLFEPYNGIIEGIEPKEIKRTLFVTSDCKLKHKVVDTVNAAVLPIVFNDEDFNEIIINRIRHFPNESDNVREEVLCINQEKTKKVLKGELLIGNNKSDCKKYQK
jgi:hypothetical protein